jgi:hypothetical protein
VKRKSVTQLVKYENVATGDVFYGYPIQEAVRKEIDGVTYIEITDSITKPKMAFVKLENLKKVGTVSVETTK